MSAPTKPPHTPRAPNSANPPPRSLSKIRSQRKLPPQTEPFSAACSRPTKPFGVVARHRQAAAPFGAVRRERGDNRVPARLHCRR